jgi:hypothetical protein
MRGRLAGLHPYQFDGVASTALIERAQILAFRLASHHLIERLGPRSVVKAAAACGIQETPTGSAALALAARVDGVVPASLDRALRRGRTLVHLWSLRGAPHVVPARDIATFTGGATPIDRASFDAFLGGWARPIADAGLDPFDLLDRMASAARSLLDGRTLDVNELRDAVLRRVRSLGRITRPKEASHDMPETLFRALGLTGAVCIVEGRGTDSVLARTDQWLTHERPRTDPDAARAELVRRFLHCYGPSTPERFAQWTGRSPKDAKAAFALIEDELVEVALGGKERAWLLDADRTALESPPSPSGARLLPVRDPYLQQRDRATLLPNASAWRTVWQPVSGPGAVLADGEIVGTWRSRLDRSRLRVEIDPFGRLPPGLRDEIDAEAERVAQARGTEAAVVPW